MRKYEFGEIYHVYNQGNNRQKVFFEPTNYLYFLSKMERHLLPVADILCYCLMPNHFHILLVPKAVSLLGKPAIKPAKVEIGSRNWPPVINDLHLLYEIQEPLSRSIGIMLSSYTKGVNKRYDRTGALFRPRTKAKNCSRAWQREVYLGGNILQRPANDYPLRCFHYIHQNPVEAELVAAPSEWPYSSAADYTFGEQSALCNQELAHELLGEIHHSFEI